MSEVKEPVKSGEEKSLNFIEQIVERDLREGLNNGRIQTRFPPEPNGYLHIGHAKAVCIDFGIAEKYGGVCNIRFDDTNPVKEDQEYIDAILKDIEWLGFHWGKVCHASDYFDQLYDFAVDLIKRGLAYVDEQSSEEIAAQKGTLTEPGTASPYRDRPVEENLRLFQEMRDGKHDEGSMTLRAKIDMAHPNLLFRDPVIYRIIKKPHAVTGTKWSVYPMYDFAHGQSDYFEGVTHSICTLEFVPHRPLYDYFIDLLQEDDYRPHQYEFNRLNLTHTIMSKRRLLELVQRGIVHGWDDPRMPTLVGMRRRGYTPQSIRNFIGAIGYTKYDGMIEEEHLEHYVSEDLNKIATRAAVVLDPIRLVITNYPEDQTEEMECVNNPEDPEAGTHMQTFGRELWIEREDFMEDAPKKYFRLTPGRETRLRSAYIVKCTGCDKDSTGRVTTVYAEYDPESKTGGATANRKVKGTIHWVRTAGALPLEVRMYEHLFTADNPMAEEFEDIKELINPTSERVLYPCYAEKFLADAEVGDHYQFVRKGYFTKDKDSTDELAVFDLTVTLRDTWKKMVHNDKANK
jgi:glutaminyl-tRNA synthetase